MLEGLENLTAGAAELGVNLDTGAAQRLLSYIALLTKWNTAYNLTGIQDPGEMLAKHLLDSLAVAPYLRGKDIIDVGTGAGLPGIPLAIAMPDKELVLLDSNGKKTRFLSHAVTQLRLNNINVIKERVEDYLPKKSFATVISRAFSDLGTFVELTQHLCGSGGRLLAMKGAYPKREIAQLPVGFKVNNSYKLHIPHLKAERHLIEITRDLR